MPTAQGRITVRRKAKDGDPGADSVVYNFIPSTSSIVLQNDGTARPSAVSARLVKHIGTQVIDITQNSFDGYRVYLSIVAAGGNKTQTNYTPGVSYPIGKNPTFSALEFSLVRNGKTEAFVSVPLVKDGTDGNDGEDGKDAFVLDLDNEVEGIPCNSSGTPTGSGTLASSNATVYKGGSIDTGWTFSKEDTDCTSSIDASTGALSVTAIAADKASVKVSATKGTQTLYATMSLYKVKPGSNGTSPVVYSIVTSASVLRRDASNTLSPSKLTVKKMRTVGNSTEETALKTLKYKRIGQDSVYTVTAAKTFDITGISTACTAIELLLVDNDGNTILDAETVPVVKDGKKGTDITSFWLVPSVSSVVRVGNDGDDARPNPSTVSVSVKCQIGAGTPYNVVDPTAEELSVSYRFEHILLQLDQVANNNLAAVSVPTNLKYTGIIFYLYKDSVLIDSVTIPFVTDGKPGDDSIRYWLQATASSISKSASGSFSPSSVSCKVMRQIGTNDPEEITSLFVRYKFTYTNNIMMLWQKYTPNTALTLSGTVKEVIFELYRSGSTSTGGVPQVTGNGTCFDVLTIPVVADGKDGAQGIQGCIYRRSKFATGFEFRNDVNLKTDGMRYIDLVYIMQDSSMFASRAKWFRCKKTHESQEDNAPQLTSNGTEAWLEFWEPLNTMEPIYTPLLLADDAVITLLQSNQVVVMKSDGSTPNVCLGGGNYPLWIGAPNPLDALFRVFEDGSFYGGNCEIKGNITATGGRIGNLSIVQNDLVGYDASGIERVRIGIGSLPDINSAFEEKKIDFSVSSSDSDTTCTDPVDMMDGKATRSAHISENRDDGNYEEDAYISATVNFHLNTQVSKIELGRFDVGYTTNTGYLSATAKGKAILYKKSGSTWQKIGEYTLLERDTEISIESSFTEGDYKVELSGWIESINSRSEYWAGEIILYMTAIFVTTTTISTGRTILAKDGFMSMQSATKYMKFTMANGFEVRFGNAGLRVGANGVQKVNSNGEWQSTNL